MTQETEITQAISSGFIIHTIKKVHMARTMNSLYGTDQDIEAEQTLAEWLDPDKSNFAEMWANNEKMSVDEIIRWAITQINDYKHYTGNNIYVYI